MLELAVVVSLLGGIRNTLKSRSRVEDLTARKAELDGEKRELSARLEYVKSDYYLEKVAREELQLSRPGETVVIIPEGVIPELKEKDKIEEEEMPIWKRWWVVLTCGQGN